MLNITKLFISLLIPVSVFAQSVDIKDVDSSDDEKETTISIKKTKKSGAVNESKSTKKWETQEGSEDVESDDFTSSKEAKADLKKECKEWEKKFRADNKDNKVISIKCGAKPDCVNDLGKHTCRSTATYTIKVLAEE